MSKRPMTSLGEEIRAMIEAEGPIGVDRYMQLCLQHPRHGYYTTREAIGAGGDFITAPEISQMFGELIGLWAAQVWLDMGAPAALRLVELGPGRGTLIADALRATRGVPGFHAALAIDLVETSPRLETLQREALGGATPPVAWHRSADAVPPGPVIVLANEFFDALPVRHYVRGRSGWHERLVGLAADGTLAFGLTADPVAIETSGRPGDVLEVGHAGLAAMGALARRIAGDGGALLAIDYGHVESGLGETLQAVRGHRYADPLDEPGKADLTAHVDFAALARAARDVGARTHGPVTQGLFLRRLGIETRAAALLKHAASPAQAADIESALARLALDREPPASRPSSLIPGEGGSRHLGEQRREAGMATLFKALAVVPSGAPVPPGFEETA